MAGGDNLSRDLLVRLQIIAENVQIIKDVEKALDRIKAAGEKEDQRVLRFALEGFEELRDIQRKAGAADTSLDKLDATIEEMRSHLGSPIDNQVAKEIDKLSQKTNLLEQAIRSAEQLKELFAEIQQLPPAEQQRALDKPSRASRFREGLLGLQAAGPISKDFLKGIDKAAEEGTLPEDMQDRLTKVQEKIRSELNTTNEEQKRLSQERNQVVEEEVKRKEAATDRESKLEEQARREVRKTAQQVESSKKRESKAEEQSTKSKKRNTQATKEQTKAEEKRRRTFKELLFGRPPKNEKERQERDPLRFIDQRGGIVGAAAFATARLGFYGIAAGVIFNIQRALREAVREAIQFESVMADIQGVLPSKNDFTAMQIGKESISAALEYGFAITEAAESAKVFAQTGQSAGEVAESLNDAFLAVRGANLELESAQQFIIAIDKITRGQVAASGLLDRISRIEARRPITAQDLVDAIQKIGPLVRQLRGDMSGLVDEFDATIGAVTTIVEQTRVSGKNAANSLKFVLSRLGRPQILRNVQALTGVELARPGGTELRPFLEILQDVSREIRQLQESGQSAKAFRVITELGGARQLQATAALMNNFDQTMQVARDSALAFGDATERTAISLDTIQTRADRVKAAWGNMASAIIENAVVKGGVKLALDGIAGTLNLIATDVRILDHLFGSIEGAFTFSLHLPDTFAPDFVDLSKIDLKEITRLDDFNSVADEASISGQDLIHVIGGVANSLSDEVLQQTGFPSLEALREALSEGEQGLETLSKSISEDLAEGLAREGIPRFIEFERQLAETNDEQERAEILANRHAAALDLLGDAAFATNAVLLKQQEQLRNASQDLVDFAQDDLFDTVARYEELSRALGQVNHPLARLLEPGGMTFGSETLGFARAEAEVSSFLRLLDRNTGLMVEAMLEGEIAAENFALALVKAAEAGKALDAPTILDFFAETLEADPAAREEAVENVAKVMETLLRASEMGGGELLQAEEAGVKAATEFGEVVDEAAEKLNNQGLEADDVADKLKNLSFITGEASANQSEFLNILDEGFQKIRQRLGGLIIDFGTALAEIQRFGNAYREIGLAFDETQQRFDAAKGFLDSLLKVEGEIQKEFVSIGLEYSAFQRAQDQVFGDLGVAAEDLSQVDQEQILSALPQDFSTKGARMKEILEGLRTQLEFINQIDLRQMFEGVEGAEPMLERIENALDFANESADNENVVGGLLGLAEVTDQAAKLTAHLNEQLFLRERLKLTNEAVADGLNRLSSQTISRINNQAEERLRAAEQQVERENQLLGIYQDQRSQIENNVRLAEERFEIEYERAIAAADEQLRNLREQTDLKIEQAAEEKERLGIQQTQIRLMGLENEHQRERGKIEDDLRQKLNDLVQQRRRQVTALDTELRIYEEQLRIQRELAVINQEIQVVQTLSQHSQREAERSTQRQLGFLENRVEREKELLSLVGREGEEIQAQMGLVRQQSRLEIQQANEVARIQTQLAADVAQRRQAELDHLQGDAREDRRLEILNELNNEQLQIELDRQSTVAEIVDQRDIELQALRNQTEILREQISLERRLLEIKQRGAQADRIISREAELVRSLADVDIDSEQRRTGFSSSLLEAQKRTADSIRLQLRTETRISDIRRRSIERGIQLELNAARERARIEIERINETIQDPGLKQNALQEVLDELKNEEDALANRLTDELLLQSAESQAERERILFDTIISKMVELEEQMRANIRSAGAGLEAVLSDFDEARHGAVQTILEPFGQVFIQSAADNFMDALLDPTQDNIFGQIGRSFMDQTDDRVISHLQETLGILEEEVGVKAANELRAALKNSGLDIAREVETSTERLVRQGARIVGSLAGALAGGGGPGSQIGGNLGTQLGEAAVKQFGLFASLGSFAGPAGALAGGLLGGVLGGLFDDDEEKKQTQALQIISENTGRNVELLELERRFREVQRGAINVPSQFLLPAFTPNAGGQTVVNQTNTVQASFTIEGSDNPDETVRVIQQTLGPMIQEELGKLGV